jgi:hypothetical protein
VILIDQLNEIYVDGQLETIDTTQWYPRITRKDFTVGLIVSESAVDDPDQHFYENCVCRAERNYTRAIAIRKSTSWSTNNQRSPTRKSASSWYGRLKGGWAEDSARPVIFYPRASNVPPPAGKGNDHDGQQHLQWLSLRGPLARQLSLILSAQRRVGEDDGDRLPPFARCCGDRPPLVLFLSG